MRRMRFVSWLTKATDTHQEYAVFIAFPLQKWFHAHTSVLRHVHNVLSLFFFFCIWLDAEQSCPINYLLIHTMR